LDLGAISAKTVEASYYDANRPDITYTWAFTLANNIPVNGKIVLTFPEDDYVLNTTPVMECSYSGGIKHESTAKQLACTPKNNTIEVTQFQEIQKATLVTIKVHHILNPPKIMTTGKFYIETYSENGYLIDGNYKLPGIKIV
jgi:hypothetical protein